MTILTTSIIILGCLSPISAQSQLKGDEVIINKPVVTSMGMPHRHKPVVTSLPEKLTAANSLIDPRESLREADRYVKSSYNSGKITWAEEQFATQLTDRILSEIVINSKLQAPVAHRLRPVARFEPQSAFYEYDHYACYHKMLYAFNGKVKPLPLVERLKYVAAPDDVTLIFRASVPISFAGQLTTPHVGSLSAKAEVKLGTICGRVHRKKLGMIGVNKFECSHYVDVAPLTALNVDFPVDIDVWEELKRGIKYTFEQVLTVAWDDLLVSGFNTTHEYAGTTISTADADKSFRRQILDSMKHLKKPSYEVVNLAQISVAIEKENAKWQSTESGRQLMCHQCHDAMEDYARLQQFDYNNCIQIIEEEQAHHVMRMKGREP